MVQGEQKRGLYRDGYLILRGAVAPEHAQHGGERP